MRFITSAILALAAIASTVVAQGNPNAFTKPDGNTPLTAGETTIITWTPGSSGTITLNLRKGPSGNLGKPQVIVAGLANTGSYSWLIPKDTPAGTDYAITIMDDNGVVPENFTPLLTIISDVAAPPTSSGTATTETTNTTSTGYPTHTKPSNSTITSIPGHHNATSSVTGYGNATSTESSAAETSTSEPTETETDAEATPTGTESAGSSSTANPTSGAISLLNSPLALIVCVLGAVFYLN